MQLKRLIIRHFYDFDLYCEHIVICRKLLHCMLIIGFQCMMLSTCSPSDEAHDQKREKRFNLKTRFVIESDNSSSTFQLCYETKNQFHMFDRLFQIITSKYKIH